ncbi:MAG: hypothetical protein QXM96_01370 [Candidatus Woesearchaeota archaeon]
MAEIPWFVWIAVGVFVGITSFFMGFLKPVTYNAFFQLMFFVSLGMIIYGYVKMKLKEKWFNEELERRKNLRGEREIEIDIDDFRNRQNRTNQVNNSRNFSYNNQLSRNTGNFQQNQINPTHYGTPRTHSSVNNQNKRCPNCGTPLLKEHKVCPICNSRV